MKYKVETDDELEAKLLVKAKDYHFLIWDFVQELRSDIKYDENASKETMGERVRLQKKFLNLLKEYNIDINLLP